MLTWFLFVVCVPQAETRVPVTPPNPPSGQERAETQKLASDWWSSLPEDRRLKIRERMRDFNAMPQEAQEELQRRANLMQTFLQEETKRLSAKDRQKLAPLSAEERGRFLRGRLRGRFSRHSQELQRHFGSKPRPHGQPFGDRFRESRLFIEGHRAEEMARQLDGLAAEGWIGLQAREEARALPLRDRADLAASGLKWKELQNLRLNGVLDQAGLEPKLLSHILTLPSREGLRVFQLLQQGRSREEALRFLPPLPGQKKDGWQRKDGRQKVDGQGEGRVRRGRERLELLAAKERAAPATDISARAAEFRPFSQRFGLE